MYRFQQKETSWLESLAHLLEHLLILILILQIAKGGEDVYCSVKFILKWNVPHVSMYPMHLDTLYLSFLFCLAQKDVTQILSSNLIATLSQWDCMASVTTAQVEYAASLWQTQQVHHAINFSPCPIRSENRFIDV